MSLSLELRMFMPQDGIKEHINLRRSINAINALEPVELVDDAQLPSGLSPGYQNEVKDPSRRLTSQSMKGRLVQLLSSILVVCREVAGICALVVRSMHCGSALALLRLAPG